MNTKRLNELLNEALRNHRRVELRPIRDDLAEIQLTLPGTTRPATKLLAEEWKPRLDQNLSTDAAHLWVLPGASARITRQLRSKRQSFVDLDRGDVYIDLPDLVVDRNVRPSKLRNADRVPSASVTRPLVDPFADRASLVTRVLLESPGTTWTVTGLAAEAGVASMLSSHIVRQLAEAKIVGTEKDGRKVLVRLIAPRALLDAWVLRYDWRRNTALTLAAPIGDEKRFIHRLADKLKTRRWALTLLAGAWRRTKYSPADRIHAYVDVESDEELKALGKELGWTPDPSGRLVLMRPAYRSSVWHKIQNLQDVPVVSDLQLVVDLWHYPLRGRETAEQLFGRIEQAFERVSSTGSKSR